MKKSLFALAALGAFAGAAQAQSSVTLYGAIDAGIYNLTNVAGTTAKPTHIAAGYLDSSVVSSVWGLKGSEDLGGGLKGIFDLQGDIQTNNGGLNQNGIFRRQANVGLSDAKLGELALGVKTNPIIATNAALMPVSGNSVSTNLSTIGGFADFFTKNAITYTSPVVGGLQAQLQYGMSNSVGDQDSGSVYAGSLAYTGIKDLAIRAAWQNRIASTTTSAANVTAPSATTGATQATNGTAKTTALGGLSYKVTNAITVAYGYAFNKGATAGADGSLIHTQQQFGVGYQATPKVLLGANYAIGSRDWSLINAQARYSLSPRTTAYTQLGYAINGKYAGQASPIATNTGAWPATNLGGVGATTVPAKTNALGFGVGVIHTF